MRAKSKKNEGVPFEEMTPWQKFCGRKSGYTDDLPQRIIEYFDRKPYETNKKTGERVANDFPSIAGFASSVGVSKQTIHEWSKHYEEFGKAYALAKSMQENFWVINSAHGKIHHSFATFIGQNYLEMKTENVLNVNNETKINKEELEKLPKEKLHELFKEILAK